MKYFICLCVLIAAVSAQLYLPPYFPVGFPYPLGYPGRSEYAASLGGAKVGLYGRLVGPYGLGYPGYFGFPYGGSEVTGASLGGAPVGIYGKEQQ